MKYKSTFKKKKKDKNMNNKMAINIYLSTIKSTKTKSTNKQNRNTLRNTKILMVAR